MGLLEDFVEVLSEGAKGVISNGLVTFEDEAIDSVKAFIESSRDDIQRWTRLLSQGLITEQDLRDLLQANKALAEIQTLKQKEMALLIYRLFRPSFSDYADR